MAEISEELIEYVKKNQYALTYEFVKKFEIMAPQNPKLGEKSIKQLAVENPEIMEVLTDDNLVLLHCGAGKDESEKILSELEKRSRNGKSIFYGPRVENQFMVTYEFNTTTFVHLFRNYPNMKDRIVSQEYPAMENNPRLSALAQRCKTLIAVETLYMSQANGLIDDRALDFLEGLYEENPNILDNISMHMLNPEILDMNEAFLKRVSRYKDQASELVAIYKTNPEVFKAFSKKIDEWESTLSVREATLYEKDVLRYATAYGAYMNDAKEEDFDDILNFCIRKAQFEFGEKVVYTPNFEDFFAQKCDELFEKKSFSASLTASNKVNAYAMKYLGVSYDEAQKMASRKFAQINIDEIEDGEVKNYIQKIKELVSLDLENPDDLKRLEELYKSNPKAFKPVMSIKSEEMANQMLLKSFNEGFRETGEKIASSENVEMLDYNGTPVRMVKMNGKFSMIIRSTDTGFKVDRELPNDSVKQYEEANPDSRVGIKSCSYITEDFPGVAPLGENGVYMIYTDVDNSNIGEIANGDLDSNVINYGVTSKSSKSFYKNELVDNSRQIYSEATIIGEKKPDAIALFNDATPRQRELAIKTASEYGVDIVLLDKDELVTEQTSRLKGYIEEFSKTGDLNVLKTLISKYETNVAGWLLNRDTDIPDESLFTGIDNSRFEGTYAEVEGRIYKAIADYCNGEKASGSKDNIERIYEILGAEKAKYENLKDGKVFPKMKMKFKAEELMGILNKRFDLGHNMEEKQSSLDELFNGELSMTSTVDQIMRKDLATSESVREGKKLVEELVIGKDKDKEEVSLDGQG